MGGRKFAYSCRRITLLVLAPSRASPLPHLILGVHKLCTPRIKCGSGLAREEASTDTTKISFLAGTSLGSAHAAASFH
ncbi:hypothetical protein C1884_04125 [Pseudomonas sp. GW460-R15]|nr:hypothetical protein C1884_04125 [Pseudomonas sp. GW460-R15]